MGWLSRFWRRNPASKAFRMPIDDKFSLTVPNKVVVVGVVEE